MLRLTSSRSQAGFTLIEVIIVMAISSALAALAIMGFATLRGQAQFSDAVERLKERVLVQRQEALATIKLSGGTDAANITFGRLLTFTPGSSTVRIETLVTANNLAPAANQPVLILASETTSFEIPWGVTYAGASMQQIGFVRSAIDGSLQTAASPAGGWGGLPFDYGDFAPNGAATNIDVIDPAGRRAYVTIDPQSNGVTRTFQ